MNAHSCPQCQSAMTQAHYHGIDFKQCSKCGGGLIGEKWLKAEELDAHFDAIANPVLPAPQKKKSRWIVPLVLYAIGLPLIFGVSYYSLESVYQAVLFTVVFGFFGLYVIHMAFQGKILNWNADMDGEAHADIEHVGSVTGDIIHDLKPALIVFLILTILIGGVMLSSRKFRAQAVKIMASMQQPDLSADTRFPEKQMRRAAKACDTYFWAREIDATVFSYDEVQEIQNICRAAGSEEYLQKAARFLKR